MNHLELFSGIGGFRRAMELIQNDGLMPFSNVGYSEINDRAATTYRAIYDTSHEIEIGDIVNFTSNPVSIKKLPRIDILTGGFPCQAFSMMGNMMGFEEDRGQMFFRIMDIVNIKKPKYLLLENVKNLLVHDGGRTYAKIIEEIDKAGYYQQTLLLNTADYGLPQKRYRVLIFARRKHFGKFSFCEEDIKRHFECIDKSNCSLSIYNNVLDILNKKVESKYYLSERVKPTILSDGTGGYKSHSEIDQIIARTLTATMNKMHRACQDNYYSDEFLQSGGKNRPSERMNKEELAKIPIRKLTPEEAFMLQGFPADFVKKAREKEVSDGALYTQSGNAVSVNTIYTLLHFLINKGIIKKPLNKRSKM